MGLCGLSSFIGINWLERMRNPKTSTSGWPDNPLRVSPLRMNRGNGIPVVHGSAGVAIRIPIGRLARTGKTKFAAINDR